MSGIISARAWGKVWAYRSTFLLGLLNTVETAIFAILLALVLGVIFGLMVFYYALAKLRKYLALLPLYT